MLYYPADPKDFAACRVRSLAGDFAHMHPAFFPKLAEKADKHGMTLPSWTVCLHNTRLRYQHPKACVQNALGDITHDNQCPVNDDIRDTMAALMRSVYQLAPLRTLQMESMNCMGFVHEYPHEKDGAGLTALEDFLLSLCFCPACMAKGRAAGVDMEHVRERVRADVKKYLALPRKAVPSQEFLTLEPNFFADDPNLMAFLRFAPKP